jgi:hypothetical protein
MAASQPQNIDGRVRPIHESQASLIAEPRSVCSLNTTPWGQMSAPSVQIPGRPDASPSPLPDSMILNGYSRRALDKSHEAQHHGLLMPMRRPCVSWIDVCREPDSARQTLDHPHPLSQKIFGRMGP